MKLLLQGTASFANGMNDSAATAADFGDGQCALLINVRPDFDGGALTRGGSQRLSAAAIAGTGENAAHAIFAVPNVSGVDDLYIYNATLGVLWRSTNSGSTWASIETGLATDAFTSGVLMQQSGTTYLLLANGTDRKSVTGATVANIAGIPAGVKHLAVSGRRLWAAGHDGNTLVASKIDDFGVWTTPDGLSIPIVTDDGDQSITGLLAWGEGLLVFKRRSIALVYGYGESSIVVQAGPRGISRSVGTPFPRSIIGAGDGGICFRSERGLEYLGGEGVSRIGTGIQTYLGAQAAADPSVDTSDQAGLYYASRNEYLLFSGSEFVAVNLSSGACWRGLYGTVTHAPARATIAKISVDGVIATHPIAVTLGGWPVVLEYGPADFVTNAGGGGTTIASRIEGALYDFGAPRRVKWARIIRANVYAPSAGSITVQGKADGTAGNAHTVPFTEGVGGRPRRIPRVGISTRGVNQQVVVTDIPGNCKVTDFEMEAGIWDRSR